MSWTAYNSSKSHETNTMRSKCWECAEVLESLMWGQDGMTFSSKDSTFVKFTRNQPCWCGVCCHERTNEWMKKNIYTAYTYTATVMVLDYAPPHLPLPLIIEWRASLCIEITAARTEWKRWIVLWRRSRRLLRRPMPRRATSLTKEGNPKGFNLCWKQQLLWRKF